MRLHLAAFVIVLSYAVCSHPASSADLTSSYSWKQMKIGGGGWIVGMDISPTEKGLIYCRTDVSGAYRWEPGTSTWKQLVTTSSMPKDVIGGWQGLEHSTDGGATWTRMAALQQSFNFGLGKSATDDGYPTVYADGLIDGVTGIYRTTDVGATWDKICDYPLGIFEWVDGMDGDKEVFGKIYLGFAQSGLAFGEIKKDAASPVTPKP